MTTYYNTALTLPLDCNMLFLQRWWYVALGDILELFTAPPLTLTLGRQFIGLKLPNGDCDELVQRYIKKTY